MMILKKLLTIISLIYISLHTSEARTDRLQLFACDSNNRRIIAAHITTGNVRGKLQCYLEPKSGSYMFRIRINRLSLAQSGTQCPSVTFQGFTSKSKLPEEDIDWQQPSKAIMVPDDPTTLRFYNCSNYKSATGAIFETSTAGQKVVFEYNTKNIGADRVGDVDFIITSFVSGASYQCPQKHFRCWSWSHICVDSSVECDEIDNCYDKSDEDNYRCSGKVLGIYLPMFIIIIILCLIILVGTIIFVFLFCRRRSNRRNKERAALDTATVRQQQVMPYYLPSRPLSYTQTPPEVGTERAHWQKQQEAEQRQRSSEGYDNKGLC